jgi:hypothetical protein
MKGRKDLSIITDIDEEKKVSDLPSVRTRRNDIVIQHMPSTTSTATHRYYQQQQQFRGQMFEEKKKQQEEEQRVLKTIVKQENNMEIFVTDAPEVDFD